MLLTHEVVSQSLITIKDGKEGEAAEKGGHGIGRALNSSGRIKAGRVI
jgi:hypothetical protein